MDRSKNATPIELSILDGSSKDMEPVVHEVLNLHNVLLAEPITDAEYELKTLRIERRHQRYKRMQDDKNDTA